MEKIRSVNGLDVLNKLEKERKGLPKYIRLDESTENRKFKQLIEQTHPIIQFEFTVTYTPQQNDKIEKIIILIWSRVRAMFDRASITGALKILWTKTVKTVVI